jgi:Kef-type K+ transport system membrane component KefB
MIAFLLGGELSRRALSQRGRSILTVSIAITLFSFLIVTGGLIALGVSVTLALLLGGIGLATAPAATRDVIKEVNAKGPVTKTILGVVAVDDAWGVLVFSILIGFMAEGVAGGLGVGLIHGLTEIMTAIAIGLIVGLPGAYVTGHIREGQPTLAEALGIVLLCAGLSLWLEASYLIAGMTAGLVIVNLAKHHEYPFHELEHISWPFLIVFFVLSGASVDLDTLFDVGLVGIGFIVLRILGRFAGGWVGGWLGGMPRHQAHIVGLALTPQAGVALGMALVAAEVAPEIGGTLLTITVATTIFFELFGPIMTRSVLYRVGETHTQRRTAAPPDPREEGE